MTKISETSKVSKEDKENMVDKCLDRGNQENNIDQHGDKVDKNESVLEDNFIPHIALVLVIVLLYLILCLT